jgi:hypothetical protein
MKDGLDNIVNDITGQIDGWLDSAFPCANFSKDRDYMLWLAYAQLFTPLFSMILTAMCSKSKKENNNQANGGIGFTGLVSMAAGALYLIFYYKVKYNQKYFSPNVAGKMGDCY